MKDEVLSYTKQKLKKKKYINNNHIKKLKQSFI